MYVLGGSGAGKTTLLQNLLLNDLQSEDPPSLVIVDSQGDLINKLSHLALFDPEHGPLASRLVLISPNDTKYPPALNIFDVNRKRLGQYDEATKEQFTAGIIQTFDYLFAGLLGADLTAKQGAFFRFVARLMLALPDAMGRNATILDMIALMDDPAPYKKAIESLPPIQRNFFERDFVGISLRKRRNKSAIASTQSLRKPYGARLSKDLDEVADIALTNGWFFSCYTREMLVQERSTLPDIASADDFNRTATQQCWPMLCDPTCEFANAKVRELLALWRDLTHGGNVPFRSEMTARRLHSLMPSVALYERVDGDGGSRRWRVRLMGSTIVHVLGEMTGKFLDESVPEEFLPRWYAITDVTLAVGAPLRVLIRSDTFGKPFLIAEQFCAPLRADDGTANIVLMVGSYNSTRPWADIYAEECKRLGLSRVGIG